MSNANSIQLLRENVFALLICATFLQPLRLSRHFALNRKCTAGLCEPAVHFLFVRAGAFVGFHLGTKTMTWMRLQAADHGVIETIKYIA